MKIKYVFLILILAFGAIVITEYKEVLLGKIIGKQQAKSILKSLEDPSNRISKVTVSSEDFYLEYDLPKEK